MRNSKLKMAVLVAGILLASGGCAREPAPPPAVSAAKPAPPPTVAKPEPAEAASPAGESTVLPAAEPAEPAGTIGDCPRVSVHCGATPGVRFDNQGRLWAVFELSGIVYVTVSEDFGATFRPPVPVHRDPEKVETNGENRPKLALGSDGRLFVSWTRKVAGRFNGDIRFSRSLDGGLSFDPPRTLNDDGLQIGHRFDSLHVDSAGHVYLIWIDKRDREAAASRGESFRGASVYYTVSTDGGQSFAPNRQVAEQACECCRIAIASGPGVDQGVGAAVLWRHIFGTNTRDHAFAVLGEAGVTRPLQRPSEDGWAIDACPHHGPAMVSAGDSDYHLAWFTAAAKRPIVEYGRFNALTGELRNRTTLASDVPNAHPHILDHLGRLLAVWKKTTEEQTQIFLKTSEDGGAAWSEATVVATTQGASDHPFLASSGDRSFLSWHTAQEGWRLISL